VSPTEGAPRERTVGELKIVFIGLDELAGTLS